MRQSIRCNSCMNINKQRKGKKIMIMIVELIVTMLQCLFRKWWYWWICNKKESYKKEESSDDLVRINHVRNIKWISGQVSMHLIILTSTWIVKRSHSVSGYHFGFWFRKPELASWWTNLKLQKYFSSCVVDMFLSMFAIDQFWKDACLFL